MRFWIASLVVLGLACSKGPDKKTERASTRASLNIVDNGARSTPPPPQSPGAPVSLTPEKAKGFVRYLAQFVAYRKKARSEQQKGTPEGGDAALPPPNPAQAAEQQVDLSVARDRAGLTQLELQELQNLFTLVQANRNIEPATIDEKLAEFEQQLATLPAPQRAEAVQQLAEMRDLRANIVDMRDARRAYGDGVVDTMLAEWPTLSRLLDEI